MHIGHYISGSGHALLIGWVLLGGVFRSEPEPFEVTGVDVISTQDFEAILAAQQAPTPETEVVRPVAPEISETPPDVATPADQAPERPVVPEQIDTPQDDVPEVPRPIAPPVISPETVEAPPEPEAPAEPQAPLETVRPVARPVTRVAPEPVAAPEPDQQIAEVDQAPTEPAETETPVEEAQEETARQEAATEIPTEPQERAGAPTTSVRPQLRPRPAAQPTQTAEAASTPSTDDSVAAALAEAVADTPAAPSGPPLTQGERESLRVAVQQCWVVDVGSQSADVVVTVAMSLDRNGRVEGNSVRLLSAQGGTESAQRSAFEAARRAVLRCQRGGYELPIEKYDHWRDVEMTFNPENMRRR